MIGCSTASVINREDMGWPAALSADLTGPQDEAGSRGRKPMTAARP